MTEKKIIEILEKFQQRDYKKGGYSICPHSYQAIAKAIVKVLKSEQLTPELKAKQIKEFGETLGF